jgi:hypothetical protein
MRRLALIGALGLLLLTTSSAFAGTANNVWRATLLSGTVHGGATLAELANGRAASVAVKLYGVKPDSTLTVTVTGGAAPISRTSFRMAGTAVHRFWMTKDELKTLDAAIDAKTTLSVQVVVTPRVAKGTPVTTTLTGTFARVTR